MLLSRLATRNAKPDGQCYIPLEKVCSVIAIFLYDFYSFINQFGTSEPMSSIASSIILGYQFFLQVVVAVVGMIDVLAVFCLFNLLLSKIDIMVESKDDFLHILFSSFCTWYI